MIERYSRGRTGEIFLLEDGNVLKLFFPEYPKKEADIEFHNAKCACEAGCTPIKVYDLVEQEGRYGYTMDFCPGCSQTDYALKHPGYLFKVGTDLAKMHQLVHSKEAPALQDVREYTCDLLDNSDYLAFLTEAEKEKAKAYIKNLPESDTVLHLDFHPVNVMVDDEGVCRVIDWTTAHRGRREVEIALMQFFFQEKDVEMFAEANPFENYLYNILRKYVGKQFLREYAERMPFDQSEVDKYALLAYVFRKKWNLTRERDVLERNIRAIIEEL